MAADVVDDDGQAGARRGRRAGHPPAVAGHDARLLAATPSATSRPTGRASPDVWVHGDWAEIDDDGFWFIPGRSDDTIKVAGKRVGPAEVESAAVAHPAVQEAAAIGVPARGQGRGGRRASSSCGPANAPDDALRRGVAGAIVGQLGTALRPEAVRFVRELPKTRNAKIMRRVIRAAVPRPARSATSPRWRTRPRSRRSGPTKPICSEYQNLTHFA